MDRPLIAIVPSAGLGTRFDAALRKPFVTLQGMPLLAFTLKVLQREEIIGEIIPVLRAEDTARGLEMARHYGLNKISRIAPGGPERQDSIYNALKIISPDSGNACGEPYVLIHDGVRPCIPGGLVKRLMSEIAGVDGVIPVIPVKDTIKEVDKDGMVHTTLDRERLRAVQTPQLFEYRTIRRAYDSAAAEGFYGTDDAALIERAGGRVRTITGSPLNIKVTTPEDLKMVDYFLGKKIKSGVME